MSILALQDIHQALNQWFQYLQGCLIHKILSYVILFVVLVSTFPSYNIIHIKYLIPKEKTAAITELGDVYTWGVGSGKHKYDNFIPRKMEVPIICNFEIQKAC